MDALDVDANILPETDDAVATSREATWKHETHLNSSPLTAHADTQFTTHNSRLSRVLEILTQSRIGP